MDYRVHIQKVLDYIEENLTDDMDMAALASVAGYSEYHFLRVFRDFVHLTPADYIRKRRISEIVRCMMETKDEKRAISDIAFAYGFHSKENFIRAFKREHHILPTEFRSARNSLRLYEPLQLEKPLCPIEAEIVVLNGFRLVAYESDEAFPPHFWNKYNAAGRSKKLSGGAVTEDFGACIWNAARHRLDYYIGIRETEARGDRTGTVLLDIPGGVYAVFDTPPSAQFDFVGTIRHTWEYIAGVWLPENGYRRTGGFELESYTEESRLFTEKIYIPITKERTETE